MRWLLLLLLAALVTGFWFLADSQDEPVAPGDDGPQSVEETGKTQEDPGAEAETRGDAPHSIPALTAEQRARLDALGFSGVTIPEGSLVVVGRIVEGVDAKAEDEEPAKDAPEAVRPLAGAEIALHAVARDGSADAVAAVTAVSRDDGRFLVTLCRSGAFELRAATPRHAPATAKVKAAGFSELADLRLDRWSTVTVTVTTGVATLQEKVLPIEGMKFEVVNAEGTVIASGDTDAQGSVALSPLPRQALTFRGVLEPYAHVEETLTIEREHQEKGFNVQLVGRLRIRALAESGAVVRDFSVCADIQRNNYGWMQPIFTDLEGKGEEGWAIVEKVKAGKHDVYATAPGYAISLSSPVEIVAGETTDLEVTLPPGHRLKGQVVSKTDGAPIEDAIVFSERDLLPNAVDTNTKKSFEPMARAARTDRNGRFELVDLTEGSHRVSATHPDFATGQLRAVQVGNAPPAERPVIKLASGAVILGHVYDDAGGPLEGSTIMVIRILDPNTRKKAPQMGFSDEHGAYRINHVQPGPCLLICSRPGLPQAMKQQGVREGAKLTVDFGKPGQGAIVEGLVTTTDGQPGTGINIMLINLESNTGGIPIFYQGPTDSQGRYRIRVKEPGRYNIQITKASKGSDFAGMDSLQVPESGVVTKDIVLTGSGMNGRVLSSSTGHGLVDGVVTLLVDGQFRGRSVLDPEGLWSIPYVPEGTYTVVATATDHAAKSAEGVQVRPGEPCVVPDITLEGGGRIVGTLRDAQGAPVGGAQVNLLDPATQEAIPGFAWPSDEDGTYEVQFLPAGSYLVTATKAGLSFPTRPVTIAIGQAPTVDLNAQ